MADELKDQRIPIMMSPSEVKAIDDWMFANRIKSRAEAIRRLTQLGIVADENLPKIVLGMSSVSQEVAKFAHSDNIAKIRKSSLSERLDVTANFLSRLFDGLQTTADPLSELSEVAFVYRKLDFDNPKIGFPDKDDVRASLQIVKDRQNQKDDPKIDN